MVLFSFLSNIVWRTEKAAMIMGKPETRTADIYGGQQWTALCLVHADSEQQQVVSSVLDNFYLEPILKFTQCNSKELQGGRSTLKT